jgi:hypothetical protein
MNGQHEKNQWLRETLYGQGRAVTVVCIAASTCALLPTSEDGHGTTPRTEGLAVHWRTVSRER